MKTKILLILILLFGAYLVTSSQNKLFPSFDLNAPAPLPKSARLLNGINITVGMPSPLGLERLQGSASGQFTETSLHLFANKFPNPSAITIVDLREESHGFVNGLPISWELSNSTWTNAGKTVAQIEADEKERLQAILKEGNVLLDPETQPLKIIVGHVQTERELVESLGMRYVRIPITENHPPTDEQIDRLVNLIQNLPQGEWLYGHCHGGRGRATLFAAVYDILKNSDRFTLEEILMRQLLLGGTDLTHVPDDFRHDVAIERIKFFRLFYAYAKETKGAISFGDWKKNN